MYLFKKTPQNSAMIFLQKAEFVTPFLISHPCHFSYNSFYFFTCIGINSNFSCIPNPCAKRFIILKLGFLVPFSILLISACVIPVLAASSFCVIF